MNDEEIANILISRVEELEKKRELLDNADLNKKPIILAIINELNGVLNNEN